MNEDRRFRLLSQAIEGGFSIGRTVVIAGAIVLIAAYLREVLIAFAGKETVANLSFSLLGKVQADRWLAYLFGVGGIAYGGVERRVRQRNIRRLTTHAAELETRLQPNRSSSELTPEGQTRREDR